jgi:hypothetical protein
VPGLRFFEFRELWFLRGGFRAACGIQKNAPWGLGREGPQLNVRSTPYAVAAPDRLEGECTRPYAKRIGIKLTFY